MPDAGAGPSARTLSPVVLEALRTAARQHGHVTVETLGRLLPVDRLSPEDLSRAIAEIEDAGIPIELDAALRRPRRPAPIAPVHASGAPDARATPQPLAPAAAPAPGSGRDAAGTTAAEIRRTGFDKETRVSAFVIATVVVVCG
jgi:hypothetical protein